MTIQMNSMDYWKRYTNMYVRMVLYQKKLVEMGDLIPIKDISLLLGPEYQKDEEMLNLNIHV